MSRAYSGYIEYVGANESTGPARPGEGLQHVQHHLVAAVGRPDLLGGEPVAEVAGQVGAQRQRVPLGIAVHRPGRLAPTATAISATTASLGG